MSDFRRDFEDDDNDDDFNFDEGDFDFSAEGDAGTTGDDDFSFEDEGEGEFTFGDEADFDLGDDAPELGEVEEREGGISRPFIIIAALMILLFVGGLIAVLVIGTGQGPTEIELTASAIAILNATTIAQLNATETQSVIAQAQTQTAEAFTDTPSPSPSPTRPPTITPTPPLDQTQIAATGIVLTAQELTRVAGLPTNTPTPPTLNPEAVQLTATALALLLGQGGGPTQEVFTPVGTPGTPRPTALPDTGLFDDLTAGSTNSVSMLALLALVLVGVIVVSRRLRTTNSR
jgi:hypothetical protein